MSQITSSMIGQGTIGAIVLGGEYAQHFARTLADNAISTDAISHGPIITVRIDNQTGAATDAVPQFSFGYVDTATGAENISLRMNNAETAVGTEGTPHLVIIGSELGLTTEVFSIQLTDMDFGTGETNALRVIPGELIDINTTFPVTYVPASERSWVLAPQVTRWRSRYRGQRESWKINLEMNQFLYDIRKLWEGNQTVTNNLNEFLYNLEYGVPDSVDYVRPYSIGNDALPGSQDLILRLERLLKRVERLENPPILTG